jgi:hypothetical protein
MNDPFLFIALPGPLVRCDKNSKVYQNCSQMLIDSEALGIVFSVRELALVWLCTRTTVLFLREEYHIKWLERHRFCDANDAR